MEHSPEERTQPLADSTLGVAEDRTVEMDRATFDEGVPKATNDSTVQQTVGGNKTEIYRNDYERALPAHYRLIRMIGRGGMSEVFLAEDERLGRNVAIKFLNSEFRREPDRMRRFNREARAASALNHPNILTIHDIGENEGVQFIVSEFVDGETLGSRIAKGPIPLDEAVNIAIQIASALAASHNAGIVHRDIKPDNVMIRRDGSVKVLDFGLAKETENFGFNSNGDAEAQTLSNPATSPGLILGTPQYMSPEQARGKQLDARTDIFSFGVILFEMVTGKQPFPGSSMVDIIAAVIGNEPTQLRDLLRDPPELLVRIIDKALRKNKDERYSSMEHLLSDLRDLQRASADVPFVDRTTRGEETRYTRPNTVRTFLGESSFRRNITLLLALGIPIFAILGWWIASGRGGSEQVSPGSMRMVPITNWTSGTGELVTAASFSQDSKMIAFAATKSGTTEIWVKPVAGGEPIRITKTNSFNQYPIWSPNGQDIAFFSIRDGNNGIWKTSFTGGAQFQIASGVGSGTRPLLWTKTGKIYFQEGTELFYVDDRTGERTAVTDFASKGIKPRTIEISADEKSVAYSVRENGPWSVFVSDLNLSKPTRIGGSNEQIDDITWSPDGSTVFYSGSVEGAYQVFRAGVGYEEPVQISNGNLDFFVQDVSPDGSKILYGSVTETSDLWRLDIADGKQVPLVNDVAAEFWPDIAPDGRSIAYQSVNQADRPYRGSVKLNTADSTTSITLATEGFAPAFSNDGQWVAYFRRSDAGISVWRVRLNGSDALKLADGGVSPPAYLATPYLKVGVGHLDWSPDSSLLAYSARTDGNSNIWVVSPDGSTRKQLTNNDDAADYFCCTKWTSDGMALIFQSELSRPGPPRTTFYRLGSIDPSSTGQRIIFESVKLFRFIGLSKPGDEAILIEKGEPKDLSAVPKITRVFSISLKTGTRKEIRQFSDAYFNNFHLSNDGSTLAFVTRKENVSALWTVRLSGGEPKVLVSETDPKVLFSSMAWSRDGRSIVFGKQTRTNLISMLSN